MVNYVGVESIDQCTRKAESLGGAVVIPKTEIPTVGWFASIKDTEGNCLGLFERK